MLFRSEVAILGSGSGGSSKIATSAQIQINSAPSAQTTYGIWQTGTDQNYFAGSITSASTLTAASGLFNGSATTGLWVNTTSFLNSYGINDTPTVTFPSGYNGYSFNSLSINPSVINNSTGNLYFGIHLGPVNLTGSQSFAAAYQLYISAAPSTTSSLNKYGIYQQGTDQNYFNGNITTPNITLISGGGGKITFADGTTQSTAASSGGGGSVSSVGLSMPSGFSVSGSPVTTSGTLTVTTSLSGMLYGTGSGITTATAGTNYTSPSGSENLSNKTISSSSIGTTYIANSHLDSTPIGATTPSTGSFTTISAAGNINANGGYVGLSSPTGTPPSNGTAQVGAYSAFGLELTGRGSTNDITIFSPTGGIAITVPTGSNNTQFSGMVMYQHYTYSTLPAPSAVPYGECFITDSTTPPGSGYNTVPTGGGGPYIRKIYSDGYNWVFE